ncbi:MAG: c-type cytochrome [Kiloniellaceae bacterium]
MPSTPRRKLAKPIALVAAAGVVLAIAVGVGIWLRLWPGSDGGEQVDLAAGQALYVARCAACHGANMEGQANWRRRKADGTMPAPPHDSSGHTWHHPDRQLFEIVKFGTASFAGPNYRTDMRAFGPEMSDQEIRTVLAYIRSIWPAEIRRRQAELTARIEAGG